MNTNDLNLINFECINNTSDGNALTYPIKIEIDSKDLYEKEKFFIDFMIKYTIFNDLQIKKKYICIECEFNSKKITLI